MLAHASSVVFSERKRQSWRTLGYGALAAPFLISLHAPPALIALTVAAFAAPSIRNFVKSHQERNGDKMPGAESFQVKGKEQREFNSLPFADQLNKVRYERSFEDVITEAANFSNEYGRKLSVICVQAPGLPKVMRGLVANLLRMNIRSKDEVEIGANGEFLICAHLLRDALSADVIHKRLERAFNDAGLLADLPDLQIGKAIYPMDGYTGADLVAHARAQLQSIARKS